MSVPAVTPDGVRDGDPAALAGLCAARGPSVLAYCLHVAGAAVAGTAAADAFARFRAAVVATDDLTELNPEALLISATRKAAAAHAGRDPQGVCAEVPSLLAARAEKELSHDDLERLDEHLESCWACRAPVARFEAAERAYRDPPDPTIDPQTAEQIVAALAAAAPARGGDSPDASPSPNGSGSHAPAAGVLPVLGKGELEPDPTDEQTSEYRTLDEFEADFGAEEPATAGRAPRAGAVVSLLGALGARARHDGRRLAPRLHGPEPEPARERVAARAAFGAQLEGVRRSRPALPLPVLLPIAVVAIALLVALFVAGVFGGSDPASSPRVAAPDDAPPSETSPADVVVVPGARDASAAAVERAKARERERERAQRAGSDAPEREVPAAPEPAAPPPAAATPPPAVTPPAPPPAAADPAPPPPARSTGNASGGRAPKIDAGNGATGSEHIPPEQDTSTVPDLAPPPETATKP